MPSSLIPEKPLTISPSLAATIGLEEAVMLQGLHERMRYLRGDVRDGYKWFVFSQHELEDSFPFWQAGDIQRVANCLRDKGVLLLGNDNYLLSKSLAVALNEKVVAAVEWIASSVPAVTPPPGPVLIREPEPPAYPASKTGAHKIDPRWQPDAEVLKQLKAQGIPQSFVQEKLPLFISHWLARNEAHFDWNGRLRKFVIQCWREEETVFAARQRATELPDSWSPNEDAYEVLERVGVSRQFIDDAIPEFILYWREKGESSATWNSKFVQHVRRQWARYTNALQNDTEPRLIPADWQPSQDVYDILQLANIDEAFARSLIAEFVLFWRDSRQMHSSWNSKFLQHVKYHWAKRHQLAVKNGKENLGFIERHTDRSWADGL